MMRSLSTIATVAAVLVLMPSGRTTARVATAPVVDVKAHAPSDTLRYVGLLGGNPIGTIRVWRDASGAIHSAQETHDRGSRGASYTILRIDADGLPTEFRTAPGDTAPNPGTTWGVIHGDSITRKAGPAATTAHYPQASFALALAGGTGSFGLLAAAAIARPDSTIPVWLAGNTPVLARVHRVTSRRIGRGATAGRADLFTVEMAPRSRTFVWLDSKGVFFADAWASWIQADYEQDAGTLVKAMDSLAIPAMAAAAHAVGLRPADGFAIVHATLIDVEAKMARPRTTVVVKGNRIVAVGEDGSVSVPPGAQVIDATGRWLVPGLWDMHAHPSDGTDGYGRSRLLSGVTTMRSLLALTNDPWEILQRQRRVDAGNELGPRLVNAGGFIDGAGPYAGPTRALVTDAAGAARWVNAYADSGFEQIKIYTSMPPALVPGITALAHARGLRVSGHVPSTMTAANAVRAGYDEIQHINYIALNFLGTDTIDTRGRGRFDVPDQRAGTIDTGSAAVHEFITFLHDRNITVDPTLCAFMPAPPSTGSPTAVRQPPWTRSDSVMIALAGMLYRGGVHLVIGTDNSCGVPDELHFYTWLGVPPIDAIWLATLNAAQYTHRGGELGSITTGKLADMILVSGDPLVDIMALSRVTQVIKDGLVYDMAALRSPLTFP